MRKLLFSLSAFSCFLMFSATVAQAEPCGLFCKKDTARKHEPFRAFYALTYGQTNINTSAGLNNWLIKTGYAPNLANESVWGFSETFFDKGWMTDQSVYYYQNNQFANGKAPDIMNYQISVGYKFLENKFFTAYGAMGVGMNMYYFYPDQSSSYDFGKYNQGTGADLEEYSLLLNPHILLYRNITNNLSMRPGRVGAFGVGIEGGFNMALFQSKWMYGGANARPFYYVPVSDIPVSAFSGFYVMGKIGWYFGRE